MYFSSFTSDVVVFSNILLHESKELEAGGRYLDSYELGLVVSLELVCAKRSLESRCSATTPLQSR